MVVEPGPAQRDRRPPESVLRQLEAVRGVEVVVVEEREVQPGGDRHPGVAGDSRALVGGQPDEPHAWVVWHRSRLRRAVVDHHQLEVRHRLSEYRRDRFVEKGVTVVRREHDREQGLPGTDAR